MASLRPRRRWFQYSLGSLLLIMTLMAVWLSWQIGFIHQRQSWLRVNASLVNQSPARQATVPIWRRMLGDVAVAEISYPPNWDSDEILLIERLFPEAVVGQFKGYSWSGLRWLIAQQQPAANAAATRGLAWLSAQQLPAAEEVETDGSSVSEEERRIRAQRKRLMNTIDIPDKKFPTIEDPDPLPHSPARELFKK